MPGRSYTQNTTAKYRYGFNGQEKTPEIFEGSTTAEYWEYDSRTVRRWNVDPVTNVSISPYLCFNGNPIIFSDIKGNEPSIDKNPKIGTEKNPVTLKGLTVYAKKISKEQKARRAALRAKEKENIKWVQDFIQQLHQNTVTRTNGLDFMGQGAIMPRDRSGQAQNNMALAIETIGAMAEHGEYFFKFIGKNGMAEKINTAGSILSGVSLVNNLAHNNIKGAAKDVAEYAIGKSPAAPYYYGGKLVKEVFTGNYTMGKAYRALDEEANILLNNYFYYKQHGEDSHADDAWNQWLRVNKAKNKILETVQERLNSD